MVLGCDIKSSKTEDYEMAKSKKYDKRAVIQYSSDRNRCKIPTQEAVEAMTKLNENEYKLLIYYYSHNSGWNFSDDKICKDLGGITSRTLNNARKSLIEKGYLLIVQGNIDIYFVGQEAVRRWQNPKYIQQDNSDNTEDISDDE